MFKGAENDAEGDDSVKKTFAKPATEKKTTSNKRQKSDDFFVPPLKMQRKEGKSSMSDSNTISQTYFPQENEFVQAFMHVCTCGKPNLLEEFAKFDIKENDYRLVIFTFIENELQTRAKDVATVETVLAILDYRIHL